MVKKKKLIKDLLGGGVRLFTGKDSMVQRSPIANTAETLVDMAPKKRKRRK